MKDSKQGIGLLLLGKPKPKGERDQGDSPRKLAAQGLIDAVNDKDASAVAEAFETLMDACKGEHSDQEDE